MSTNQSDGLWTLGFGEVGATLKGMQDAGVTPELLARFRSNKAADKQWAKEMARIMLGNEQLSVTIPEPVKAVLLELLRTADVSAQEVFKANDFFIPSSCYCLIPSSFHIPSTFFLVPSSISISSGQTRA